MYKGFVTGVLSVSRVSRGCGGVSGSDGKRALGSSIPVDAWLVGSSMVLSSEAVCHLISGWLAFAVLTVVSR